MRKSKGIGPYLLHSGGLLDQSSHANCCPSSNSCSARMPESESGILFLARTSPASSRTQISWWASAQSTPTNITWSPPLVDCSEPGGQRRRPNGMDQCSWHDVPPALSVNLTDWLGHDLGRVRSGSLVSHLGRVASAVARVSSNFGPSSPCGLVPLPRSLLSSPTTLVRVNSVNRSPYEYRLCRQGEPLGQSTPVREGTTEIRRVVPASACSSCEK